MFIRGNNSLLCLNGGGGGHPPTFESLVVLCYNLYFLGIKHVFLLYNVQLCH